MRSGSSSSTTWISGREFMRSPSAVRSGSSTRNTEPSPGTDSARIRPPCASTSVRAIDRPSPMPWPLVVKNESKSFGRFSGGDSLTAVAAPRCRRRLRRSRPAATAIAIARRSSGASATASMALSTRFRSTCWIWMRSPRNGTAPPGAGAWSSSVTPRRRASERSSDSTSRAASRRSKGWRSTSLPREQGPQPADHFAGPQVVAADVGEDLGELGPPVAAGIEDQVGGVGVGENRAERLVDLVRDRAQQLAGDRQARGVRELEAAALLGRARRRGGGGARRAAGRSAPPGAPAHPPRRAPEGDRPRRASVRGRGRRRWPGSSARVDLPAANLPPVDLESRRDLGRQRQRRERVRR